MAQTLPYDTAELRESMGSGQVVVQEFIIISDHKVHEEQEMISAHRGLT